MAGLLSLNREKLRLPELEPMLEVRRSMFWFPVPGMDGGFSYWLDGEGDSARLISESWCRVAGGSGQRHELTATLRPAVSALTGNDEFASKAPQSVV